MQRLIFGCLVLGLALTGLPAADPPPGAPEEPPLRLKKKDKPNQAGEKLAPRPGDKIKEDDPPEKPDEPAIDEEALLQEILKNSRKVEDRLANKELDDATKQLQRDVLDGIDKLIKQSQQPPQTGQQGGGQQAQGQQGQKGGRGSQQARGQRGNRGSQTARGQGQGQDQQDQEAQGQYPTAGNRGGLGGTSPTEEAAKLAEIYKDVWGHLPEALRAEMNAYSREQFMDKYRDQLKRYYSTLAEKGRKE